jgi:hypothetical protein
MHGGHYSALADEATYSAWQSLNQRRRCEGDQTAIERPSDALTRRRHQCLLQLLEQPLVRGIVAEPLLATADFQGAFRVLRWVSSARTQVQVSLHLG